MEFAGKVVLITGASSGVGAATALHFSKLSANLVLTGRKTNNLNAVAALCQSNSGLQPLTITADVSEDSDVEKIVETTKKHFGRLDVLVNNAGVLKTDSILDTSMDIFDEIIGTNLRAVVNLTRLAVPLLIESRGSIVNISSVVAVKALPQYMTYGFAKAAIDQFTKFLAVELGPKKVRINSIILGYCRTEIFKRAGVDVGEFERTFLPTIPLGEIIEAEDVGKMIAYLASDAAKAMTGSNVVLDSGLLST